MQLYLTEQGPTDPAVAAAKCARTVNTYRARLTYGGDDTRALSERRWTKLNQYGIEPDVRARGNTPLCGFEKGELTFYILLVHPSGCGAQIIGEGAFSVVHLGRYQTGFLVAIKKLNRAKLQSGTKYIECSCMQVHVDVNPHYVL